MSYLQRKKIICNEDLLSMLSIHSEKVICLYCNKEYTRKNLDRHNTTKHEG